MKYIYLIFILSLALSGVLKSQASPLNPNLLDKEGGLSILHINLEEAPQMSEKMMTFIDKEKKSIAEVIRQTIAFTFIFSDPHRRHGLTITQCKPGTDMDAYIGLCGLEFVSQGIFDGNELFKVKGIWVMKSNTHSLVLSSFHRMGQDDFLKLCKDTLEKLDRGSSPGIEQNIGKTFIDFHINNKQYVKHMRSRFAARFFSSLDRMQVDIVNEQKQLYFKAKYEFSSEDKVKELAQMVQGFKTMAASFITLSKRKDVNFDFMVPMINAIEVKSSERELQLYLSPNELEKSMPPMLDVFAKKIKRNKRGKLTEAHQTALLEIIDDLKSRMTGLEEKQASKAEPADEKMTKIEKELRLIKERLANIEQKADPALQKRLDAALKELEALKRERAQE